MLVVHNLGFLIVMMMRRMLIMISYHLTKVNLIYQVDIRKPNEDDFASNDTEDNLDKEEKIKLKSIKSLTRYNFLSQCWRLI